MCVKNVTRQDKNNVLDMFTSTDSSPPPLDSFIRLYIFMWSKRLVTMKERNPSRDERADGRFEVHCWNIICLQNTHDYTHIAYKLVLQNIRLSGFQSKDWVLG